MLRQRFSHISVTAMLFAAVLATLIVLRPQGDGFGGHQGFPFAWCVWPDTVVDGRIPRQYSWGRLAADIIVWFAAVVAFGLLVERTAQRLMRYVSS